MDEWMEQTFRSNQTHTICFCSEKLDMLKKNPLYLIQSSIKNLYYDVYSEHSQRVIQMLCCSVTDYIISARRWLDCWLLYLTLHPHSFMALGSTIPEITSPPTWHNQISMSTRWVQGQLLSWTRNKRGWRFKTVVGLFHLTLPFMPKKNPQK